MWNEWEDFENLWKSTVRLFERGATDLHFEFFFTSHLVLLYIFAIFVVSFELFTCKEFCVQFDV